MPLSPRQLHDVCMTQNGDSGCCRYLSQDATEHNKCYCLKKTSKKAIIDDAVVSFLEDLKDNGLDPKRQTVPLGDNCQGVRLNEPTKRLSNFWLIKSRERFLLTIVEWAQWMGLPVKTLTEQQINEAIKARRRE